MYTLYFDIDDISLHRNSSKNREIYSSVILSRDRVEIHNNVITVYTTIKNPYRFRYSTNINLLKVLLNGKDVKDVNIPVGYGIELEKGEYSIDFYLPFDKITKPFTIELF